MEKPKTLFECLARQRGISVEEMRSIISARIEQGMNDPDPVKRASWERIPRAGEAEGRGDLLRWYPNL